MVFSLLKKATNLNSIFKKQLKKKKVVKVNSLLIIFFKLKKKALKSKLKTFKSFFKLYIQFEKKKVLLSLKKKKKNKFFKRKKKLDSFLKIFLLDHYSLIHLLKLKKKKKKKLKKKVKYLLFVSIRSNNIFINFFRSKNNKVTLINFWSSGVFQLHCTKRKLKFVTYTLLKEITNKLKGISFYIIKIFCAQFLHKFLYKNFKKLFLKSKFIIFTSFKIFNGCRSKKKRRKKHLKFRILR